MLYDTSEFHIHMHISHYNYRTVRLGFQDIPTKMLGKISTHLAHNYYKQKQKHLNMICRSRHVESLMQNFLKLILSMDLWVIKSINRGTPCATAEVRSLRILRIESRYCVSKVN